MSGKTKVYLALAVVAFVPLVMMYFPAYVRAHSTQSPNACLNTLRQIDGAKQQWMLQYGKSRRDSPTWNDLLPYLGSGTSNGTIPVCPKGGTYIIGRVGEPARCTIHGTVDEN